MAGRRKGDLGVPLLLFLLLLPFVTGHKAASKGSAATAGSSRTTDTDGDGIPNHLERSLRGIDKKRDTDHDGVPDYLDQDDDADGIPDHKDPDRNGDGILDTHQDADGDGIPD